MTVKRQQIDLQVAEGEQQYRSLFNQNPDAVFLMNTSGDFININTACCHLLEQGFDDLLNKKLEVFCSDGFKQCSRDLITEASKGKSPSAKLSVTTPSGKVKHLSVTIMPVLQGEELRGIFGIAKDITEAIRTRDNLKKLSLIAEKTVNPVIITDVSGRIEWVNEAFQEVTGYCLKDITGMRPGDILHGEETDCGTLLYIENQIKKREPFKCEIQRYKKNGELFWAEVEGQPLYNEQGALVNYFEIETDITERKKTLQNLVKKESEIRGFARQLNQVLEAERAHIAREIHDEFGQQLIGLKMSMSVLKKTKNKGEDFDKSVNRILLDIDHAIQSLKQLATELRPGILDSLGLFESIEWLIKDFEKKSSLKCLFHSRAYKGQISNEVAICFFRVCQEALTNILKHANASSVKVEIYVKDKRLNMKIMDNGKGMVSDKFDDPFSLGLIGMRERAILIGGELEIGSNPGLGTSILLRVDVE